MWTFVTFHAALSPQSQSGLESRGVHLALPTIYENQINWLMRSAEARFPGCRKIIITDQDTQFNPAINDQLSGEIELFRAQAPGSGAMLSRAQAQVEWLEFEDRRGQPQPDPILLLDSDMLIGRGLDLLSAMEFEVALTFRKHQQMPINGGAFFVAPHARAQALHFSRWVRDIYQEMFTNDIWYGHQHALIEAVGRKRYEKSDKTALLVPPRQETNDGNNETPIRLQLLNVHEWNRTVDVDFRALKSLHHARLLHFKGERKKLMRAYFFGFLSPASGLGTILPSRIAFYGVGFLQSFGKRTKRLRRSLTKRLRRGQGGGH